MHGSDVLNLVLACVMWIVLKEWDSRMFEWLRELPGSIEILAPSLFFFHWSLVWGLIYCSSILNIRDSLRFSI